MAKDDQQMLTPRLRFQDFLDSPKWKLETLSTFVAALDSGVSVNAGDRPATAAEIGVLKTSCVTNGVFDLSENKVVLEPKELSRVTENVRGGTIIISRMNTVALVGANAYIEDDAANIFLPDRLWAAKPAPSVNMRFIAYFLGSDRGRAALSELAAGSSGSMKNISKAAVLELLIPAPEPDEQQRISDCLTSLDKLIAAQGRKVETLKAHKKGLMQQLFPREGETLPRLRFPEFRDAPGWESASIQKLIDSQFILGHLDGNHGELYPRADEFSAEGVPYITANDFRNGCVEFNSCKRIPLERALKFKKGVARDGDILFAHNATVGPVAKLTTNYEFVILSTTATYFRCDTNQLVNDFLRFALTSPLFVDQYTRVMSQSTRDQVPITAQRKFHLHLPKFSEQQQIADCLCSLDAEIAAQTNKLAALKTHKQGLMQQLFPSPEGTAM